MAVIAGEPLFTIGIPFLNAERTLADAIRSVFAQGEDDWELILVDDGSSDRSLELARSVRDRRVRVVSDGRQLGLAARLNQIIDAARGELIVRLDADDMMSPRRLEVCGRTLDGGVELVTSAMAILSEGDRVVAVRDGGAGVGDARALLRARGVAHAPCVGRRRWWRANRYDESLMRSEDLELWCRARASGTLRRDNLAVLEDALYFCREGASVTARKVLRAQRMIRAMIRLYGPGWVGRPPSSGSSRGRTLEVSPRWR